jgi:hypothetical protein
MTTQAMDLGYAVLSAVGAYFAGRVHQFISDAKRGLGPKLQGRGNRD